MRYNSNIRIFFIVYELIMHERPRHNEGILLNPTFLSTLLTPAAAHLEREGTFQSASVSITTDELSAREEVEREREDTNLIAAPPYGVRMIGSKWSLRKQYSSSYYYL